MWDPFRRGGASGVCHVWGFSGGRCGAVGSGVQEGFAPVKRESESGAYPCATERGGCLLLHTVCVPRLPSRPVLRVPGLPRKGRRDFLRVRLILTFVDVIMGLLSASFRAFHFLAICMGDDAFIISLCTCLHPYSNERYNDIRCGHVTIATRDRFSLVFPVNVCNKVEAFGRGAISVLIFIQVCFGFCRM